MSRFEEAARKWLKDNDWDYQKYNDRRPDRSAYDTLMNYEISGYLSDAYEAGAHFGFAEAVRRLRSDEAKVAAMKTRENWSAYLDKPDLQRTEWADWPEKNVKGEMMCETSTDRYKRLHKAVKEHMGWDDQKTTLWFDTLNPNTGGMSPFGFLAMRPEKAERWIMSLIEKNSPSQTVEEKK